MAGNDIAQLVPVRVYLDDIEHCGVRERYRLTARRVTTYPMQA